MRKTKTREEHCKECERQDKSRGRERETYGIFFNSSLIFPFRCWSTPFCGVFCGSPQHGVNGMSSGVSATAAAVAAAAAASAPPPPPLEDVTAYVDELYRGLSRQKLAEPIATATVPEALFRPLMTHRLFLLRMHDSLSGSLNCLFGPFLMCEASRQNLHLSTLNN